MNENGNVTVVGCGVIGLTSAIRLQEAGFDVRIITRDLPSETTSAVAAAVWFPYKAAPHDRVRVWSKRTLDVFYDLARDAEAGVSLRPFVELFDEPITEPWWRSAVRQFRRARPDELPPGYTDGFVIEAPLAETPRYLPYLQHCFENHGGHIEVRPKGLAGLNSLYAPGQLIVNCTGLGARALVGDEAVYPIRGHVVRVTNPGLTRCLGDDYGPRALAYVLPRSQDCILGGTAEERAWDTTPNPQTTQEILRNARQLEPRLRDAEVLDARVGLRPARDEVRLEVEHVAPGCAVIHNYGHGGSGFTLSWGCADEVVHLARRWMAESR